MKQNVDQGKRVIKRDIHLGTTKSWERAYFRLMENGNYAWNALSRIIWSLTLALSSGAANPWDVLAKETECGSARISEIPRSEEEWNTSFGPSCGKARIKTNSKPDKWLTVYEPKWSRESLLGRQDPLSPPKTISKWDDLARMDCAQGKSSPALGAAIGGLVGAGAALTLYVTCDGGEESGGLGCIGAALIVAACAIPIGMIVGASITGAPDWVALYCAK